MHNNSLSFIIFLFLASLTAMAQKNDTIYLKNGDRISGEFKKFDYGLLSFSTDAMKTVSIEFDQINTIHSSKYFEVRMNTGQKFFGHLTKSEVLSTVNIVTFNDTVAKRLWDIVLIIPIKSTFFSKIDGSIDIGSTYTKASDVFQYSVNTQVTYRTNYYYIKFTLESLLTDDGSKVSKNNTLALAVTHLLPNKWLTRISSQIQQNTQLDLDYRAQLGYTFGYDVVRNNAVRFNVYGGLVANQEKTIADVTITENLEAVFASHVKWFKYRHPKIDVTSGFEVYPSLTSFGRVRMEYDLSAKYELFKNFFFNTQFYDNFDSEPSVGAKAKNDWGIITSVGFTF